MMQRRSEIQRGRLLKGRPMSSTKHGDANESERRRWNDDLWTETWPTREPLTNAATGPLLDALLLQDGERVLDVGSGAGPT